jgi:hypothetical protein
MTYPKRETGRSYAGEANVRRVFALFKIALAVFSLIQILAPSLRYGTAAQNAILAPTDVDCGKDGSPALPTKNGAHPCQSVGLCCFGSPIEAPPTSFVTSANLPDRTPLIVSNAASIRKPRPPTGWATAWSSRAPPSA